MRLYLGNNRRPLIRDDLKRLFDQGQTGIVECHVDHGASHRNDAPASRLCRRWGPHAIVCKRERGGDERVHRGYAVT
jgi:hypothetical protein